jgi:hypothetical protein
VVGTADPGAGEPAVADATGEAAVEGAGEAAVDAAGEPVAAVTEAAGDPLAPLDVHGVAAPEAAGEPVGCGGMKVQPDVRTPLEQAAANSRTAPDVSNGRMKGRFMFMRQIVGQVAASVREPSAPAGSPRH